jgi:hypothetical protein
MAAAPVAADNSDANASRACAAKVKGLYGFQCHGSAFNGFVFGPVTFVGTVEGHDNGIYEGHGTFSSPTGSLPAHVAGAATFEPSTCFGHIIYTTNDVTFPPPIGLVHLPPAAFDFIGVDGGDEILGTGVAYPPDATGDFVPRLTCRLVRVR